MKALVAIFLFIGVSSAHADPFCDLVIGSRIQASDGTFLGVVSKDKYNLESISNPYARYGNQYSPDSILNPYGIYGSKYGPKSPWNQYAPATSAPVLERNLLGVRALCRLTSNQYAPQPVCDPVKVLACVGLKPPKQR